MSAKRTHRAGVANNSLQLNVSAREWVVFLMLLLLIALSALGVVYSSYTSRQLFSEVQRQYAQTLHLKEQWGRLLLEQSTWATHARVERLAKTRLSMQVPDPATIVVVK